MVPKRDPGATMLRLLSLVSLVGVGNGYSMRALYSAPSIRPQVFRMAQADSFSEDFTSLLAQNPGAQVLYAEGGRGAAGSSSEAASLAVESPAAQSPAETPVSISDVSLAPAPPIAEDPAVVEAPVPVETPTDVAQASSDAAQAAADSMLAVPDAASDTAQAAADSMQAVSETASADAVQAAVAETAKAAAAVLPDFATLTPVAAEVTVLAVAVLVTVATARLTFKALYELVLQPLYDSLKYPVLLPGAFFVVSTGLLSTVGAYESLPGQEQYALSFLGSASLVGLGGALAYAAVEQARSSVSDAATAVSLRATAGVGKSASGDLFTRVTCRNVTCKLVTCKLVNL